MSMHLGEDLIGTVVSEEKIELATPNPPPGRVTLADIAAWDIDGAAHRVFSHRRGHYDGPPYVGLPFGQIGARGLQTRSESLMFGAGDRGALYGNTVTPAALIAAGYVQSPAGSDRWWRQDGRTEYTGAFSQPTGSLDAMGNQNVTAFDAFELLPIRAIDANGNVRSADNDPWALLPVLSVDANGNQARVVFDPRGFVVATVMNGKAGAQDGDTIQNPTTFMRYDLHGYWRSALAGGLPQPCSVHTFQRTAHVTIDPAAPHQEKITYFDASGRELQTKMRAEPKVAAGNVMQWVASGWQTRNNKGWVIGDYEPYFTALPDFEPGQRSGAPTITTYDALGRVVRKDAPDGSVSRYTRRGRRRRTMLTTPVRTAHGTTSRCRAMRFSAMRRLRRSRIA